MPDDVQCTIYIWAKRKQNWIKRNCNETKSFWWKASHLFLLGTEKKNTKKKRDFGDFIIQRSRDVETANRKWGQKKSSKHLRGKDKYSWHFCEDFSRWITTMSLRITFYSLLAFLLLFFFNETEKKHTQIRCIPFIYVYLFPKKGQSIQ